MSGSGHNPTTEAGAIARDGRRGAPRGDLAVQGVRGQWSRNGFAIPCRGLDQLAATGGAKANPLLGHKPRADGTVDVTCWCDRTVVRVTPDDVRAGRTATCGRPGCAAP